MLQLLYPIETDRAQATQNSKCNDSKSTIEF